MVVAEGDKGPRRAVEQIPLMKRKVKHLQRRRLCFCTLESPTGIEQITTLQSKLQYVDK